LFLPLPFFVIVLTARLGQEFIDFARGQFHGDWVVRELERAGAREMGSGGEFKIQKLSIQNSKKFATFSR
jgi:hypothetical protein